MISVNQGPSPEYPNNMVPTSSRRKPEGKAMMLLRHLLHHKKSTGVPFFHMYMLLWAVAHSAPPAHPPWCQSTLQTDQLINERGRTGGSGPGLMGVGMGERNKVQSGWLGSQRLTMGRRGMGAGTAGLAQ